MTNFSMMEALISQERSRTFLRNKIGAGHFAATNSAQVKLGASQTRPKSNSAQVKLGAGQNRRRKKKELTLLYSA